MRSSVNILEERVEAKKQGRKMVVKTLHPRGIWMDVKTKGLHEKGFVRA